MVTELRPALVVDIGGTLVTRERPGAARRAMAALTRAGIPVEAPAVRRFALEAVLTGSAIGTAASALADGLHLAPGQRRLVEAALSEPEGPARLRPGATRLLDEAHRQGWRVLAATNAASWVPDLPPALSARIETVHSSHELGLIKQDVAFWHALQRKAGLDPRSCLVLGDSTEADVVTPRRAGFCALPAGDGAPDLGMVTRALREAGAAPVGAVAVVAGTPTPWADRWVLECPHLRPLLAGVTRLPVRLATRTLAGRAALVRRRGRPPVVVREDGDPPPALAWLVARRTRPRLAVPGDLSSALEAAGADLRSLPPADARHLVSLVAEARDPATRQARVRDVLGHLTAQQEAGS